MFETRNYFIEEIEQNELWVKSTKRFVHSKLHSTPSLFYFLQYVLGKVKLFARCSLLLNFWSLLVNFCSLFFACCWLLFALCSLLFTCFSLLFTRCSTRNSKGFFNKGKQKALHINLYKKFNLWISWKLGQFSAGEFQQSLWVLKTKQPENFLFRADVVSKFYIKNWFFFLKLLWRVFCAHFC